MMTMSEAIEQEILCNYIRTNYPGIVFLSDASGIKMTMGQAVKWSKLKSHRGIPDLIILCPRNGWHGLMIELKRTGEKIYKKDGTLKTTHLNEQWEVLSILEYHGYIARFCIGFEEARDLLNKYMNGEI